MTFVGHYVLHDCMWTEWESPVLLLLFWGNLTCEEYMDLHGFLWYKVLVFVPGFVLYMSVCTGFCGVYEWL